MDRLTLPHYGGDGHYMKCSESLSCNGNCGDCEELDKIVDRLAAYEDIEMPPADIEQTLLNFSSFLMEMTGGRMSKTNYTVQAMVAEANDYQQKELEEAQKESYDLGVDSVLRNHFGIPWDEAADLRNNIDHLRKLLGLEKEGRLLVLPCPIGKTVYVHRTMCDTLPSGRWNSDCMYIQDCPRHGRPCPQEVRTTKFTASMYAGLGKTFWLTGEEAEAAIPADRRNKKNGTTH